MVTIVLLSQISQHYLCPLILSSAGVFELFSLETERFDLVGAAFLEHPVIFSRLYVLVSFIPVMPEDLHTRPQINVCLSKDEIMHINYRIESEIKTNMVKFQNKKAISDKNVFLTILRNPPPCN